MKNISEYTFFHKLKQLPYIEEIWVFGSRARLDHNSRSDIDLAIIAPSCTEDKWQEIQEIIEEADTLLKIDCVNFLTVPEGMFKSNILRYKKIIYKKGSDFMEKEFWKDYFDSLGDALNRLKEIMDHPDLTKIDYLRDAALQRFEFSIELYWKVLKKFLAYNAVETTTPRDVINKAYQFKVIDDEKIWLAMLTDRNITSHVYKQSEADIVFSHLKDYLPFMLSTYELLKTRLL